MIDLRAKPRLHLVDRRDLEQNPQTVAAPYLTANLGAVAVLSLTTTKQRAERAGDLGRQMPHLTLRNPDSDSVCVVWVRGLGDKREIVGTDTELSQHRLIETDASDRRRIGRVRHVDQRQRLLLREPSHSNPQISAHPNISTATATVGPTALAAGGAR